MASSTSRSRARCCRTARTPSSSRPPPSRSPSGSWHTRTAPRGPSSSTCDRSARSGEGPGRLARGRPVLLAGSMATPLRQPAAQHPAPNASDFLELYAFERPEAAIPADAFVEELKALVRDHPVEPTLAEALKYGRAERDAVRRWIKDYWQFIRLDAQGTAASIARCRRRGLFIALSPLVSRKSGFHQVTRPPLDLFLRFAAAFGLERE